MKVVHEEGKGKRSFVGESCKEESFEGGSFKGESFEGESSEGEEDDGIIGSSRPSSCLH